MSTQSNIEWTQAAWNPVSGCTRVHAGCDHCYAVTMTHRLASMGKSKYAGLTVLNPRGDRHFNGVVKCHEDALTVPLRWRKPKVLFVNSMSDLFHEKVPFEFIDHVFAVMALCPHHTFQVLTKRPERMAAYLSTPGRWGRIAAAVSEIGVAFCTAAAVVKGLIERGGPLPNVWIGTSVSDQPTADAMIPHLLRCPGVRFVSYEPALGPVDFSAFCGGPYVGLPGDKVIPNYNFGIDWIIVGGESGPGARPFDVAWARSVIAQGKAAGVPVFVKQLGKWITGPHGVDGWQGNIDRWLLSDGKGGTATWRRPILRSYYSPQYYDQRPANAIAWGLGDVKGGDMSEWPDDLRVRESPTGCEVGQ